MTNFYCFYISGVEWRGESNSSSNNKKHESGKKLLETPVQCVCCPRCSARHPGSPHWWLCMVLRPLRCLLPRVTPEQLVEPWRTFRVRCLCLKLTFQLILGSFGCRNGCARLLLYFPACSFTMFGTWVAYHKHTDAQGRYRWVPGASSHRGQMLAPANEHW